MLGREDVSVMLSDINMPRMNGLELLQRSVPIRPQLKTIMVTAYGDMKNIRSAMNNGAVDFLTKPIDFEDLKATLQRTIEMARQSHERVAYQNDLAGARTILEKIFPEACHVDDHVEICGSSLPAQIVGGDCYDYYPAGVGMTGLMIADVCGKGMPAALFMYFTHNLLRIISEEQVAPREALVLLNRYIHRFSPDNTFVTIAYAILVGNELRLASGGHQPVLIRRADGSGIEEYKPRGRPLGILQDGEYGEEKILLRSGDLVVFQTDGVVDALDAADVPYGEERLQRLLKAHGGEAIPALLQRILADIAGHVGRRAPFDDTTLMLLRFR
jgi:sigma-B regulation protein RsbU (phosphoserine phosphatase)